MIIRTVLAGLLIAGLVFGPVAYVVAPPLAAQDAGGDDDDDDDDDDDGDDDNDVEDPDEVDPGDDGAGGDDAGGDDAGGDDDIGGDDPGGDDDAAGGGDDDDGAGGGGDDDDGAGGGGDDGAGGGDDDDDGAGGGGGDDDDGAGGGGDDDDDRAPGGGGNDDDNDDITDDRGDLDDAGDDVDQEPGQWENLGGETEAERAERDERDRIDTDGDGFRYRRGEFVALDLTDKDLAELQADGFQVLAREPLKALSGTVLLLRGPAQATDEAALDKLEELADPDSIGYNHLFDSSSVQTKRKRAGAVPERQACGCDIGLIDTGVATNLSYFKHVTLVQRAFNGKAVQPALHGTAVAHLMAGTRKSAARATKIYFADIFGGPRETAGSSFALVKALDWMAAQGVPVINVSLSGPRNPAVAKAIQRITGKGHTIVAAAGNDGPAAPPVFPGAYDGVVGVTAVDGSDRVYRYANRGAYVDFSARGVGVAAIDTKGDVRDATGTSFAAPVIAARLAAQLRTPDAAAAQRAVKALEKEARDLGPPGRDPVYGAGLVGGIN